MRRGHVEAIVGRFTIPNRDGWILQPGCLEPRLVLISLFGHSVLRGDRAVGVGRFVEVQDLLLFVGRFSVEDPRGRYARDLVRHLGDRCRWSIGYDVLRSTTYEVPGTRWRAEIVEAARPCEVSPVLRGSCPVTRTVALR